eukprot:CAMPEP_0172809668 /NCGR_PEP_ID=MMETSP1075-20121228/8355_1 /TAXON_ID=2916 /ORGANISM="Ceratium fusus, Strain PA161109" /LENGTH=106 /DNA_ID=CAMNT_0013648903 /DNA_START=237 /DNA_END=554 /DNA_ORIENTATION=+
MWAAATLVGWPSAPPCQVALTETNFGSAKLHLPWIVAFAMSSYFFRSASFLHLLHGASGYCLCARDLFCAGRHGAAAFHGLASSQRTTEMLHSEVAWLASVAVLVW